MRKNKGRLTYYLEVIDKKYHFVKKISSYSKEFTDGIDFTKNGLRPVDKNILLTMVKEYKESDA